SMGIKQVNKESLDDIINKEVYSLILDNAKEEVFNLNINYIKVNKDTRSNKNEILKLSKYIQNQLKIKKEYLDMQEKQKDIIRSLKNKHKEYQDNLENLITKQNRVSDLLGNLSILKNTELKKETDDIKRKKRLERERLARQKKANKKKELDRKKRLERLARLTEENIRKRAKLDNKKVTTKEIKKEVKKETKNIKFISKKKLDDDINIKVKKIGSSTKGIKISKYYGRKTIAPLKDYTIVKKFGKYYDSVYNIELFNESISLKPKKTNSKVYNVFNGEIVYAKNNSGLLANVVIVKHSKGLHTIYSHLDKISPTLKVGKWIKKGYVVGRVNNILQFQATKNSRYIDPEKLFRK
ncbi:MAG: peptidoglycan DD-metalloendopeptidase family protein, partial [Campylobacterota bacterium]|nr:peptidoglycan DD-metalloendopeptidase family protein [Campylobacterota bacterium]